MVTNEDRANWAQTSVDAFQNITNCDDEDAIGDLLANLCHLIARNGDHPYKRFQSAYACFREEVNEAQMEKYMDRFPDIKFLSQCNGAQVRDHFFKLGKETTVHREGRISICDLSAGFNAPRHDAGYLADYVIDDKGNVHHLEGGLK
jgi:hypothetical protein